MYYTRVGLAYHITPYIIRIYVCVFLISLYYNGLTNSATYDATYGTSTGAIYCATYAALYNIGTYQIDTPRVYSYNIPAQVLSYASGYYNFSTKYKLYVFVRLITTTGRIKWEFP